MKYIIATLVLSLLLYVSAENADDIECVRGPSSWYQGSMNVTRNGIPCQRWDVQFPHHPNYIPRDGGHHSYCRNPDNDIRGLWCYTSDPETKWDYCDVAKCHDESLLVWSDLHDRYAHILATHADPELINPAMTSSGHFNLSVLVKSDETADYAKSSEFTSITGSLSKQLLYYVDHRRNYIGKLDLETSSRSEHLHGVAANIKAIAFDWMSGNVYWSDARLKAVLVGDEELKYHGILYNSDPDLPCGVAVHPLKRYVFFSIYKPLASKLMRMETSGKNLQVLLKFPLIFDVTSVTVDYHDNRLYLSDFWGYGSVVLSTDLNGGNRIQHFYRPGSKFCGIASHLEYVYVADESPEFDHKGELTYSLYLISKKFTKTLKYAIDGEPRGIAVLPEFVRAQSDENIGSCSSSPPCDHICLPQINTTRMCLCSLGFVKKGDTQCLRDFPSGPRLFAVDSGRQSIFSISVTSQTDITLFTEVEDEIVSLATNPMRQGEVAWSERSGIYKSNGKNITIVVNNVTASRLDVDTISGNIYYYDETEKDIYVANPTHKVTILEYDSLSDVTMLAVDVVNRFLFWCDSRSSIGEGQVWRSNMDGSNKSLVLDYLMWPQAVAVAQQRQSLFIMDAELEQLIELPLTSSGNDAITQEYDLSEEALRKSAAHNNYIVDIKVYNDDVYFVRSGSNVISKYSLLNASIENIGSELYDVTSLGLHRESTEVPENPCSPCDGLCIPTSTIACTFT